ncbi:MAG: prepilin-type N-terminal cleavage/methylation domain-containing protein [Rickettsiales bacterium]|nr:MAG: prepilin-type N-terminal cleavage/methylation domain-containing protein [Rickettsiales bacterium]
MSKNDKAFSLIELSIVITVIALIIAGTIVGADMLRRSRIRSVINESTKYITAIYSFKYQYNYYPGDIPSATSLIPSATYNGNGDFIINYSSEAWNSWVHLNFANLIDSTWDYSQTEPGSGYNPNTSWRMESPSSAIYNFQAYTINTIGLSGCGLNHTNTCDGISPLDAYDIDLKMDDSNPSTGSIITTVSGTGCIKNPTGNNVNSASYTNTDAFYNRLNAKLLCRRIMFII